MGLLGSNILQLLLRSGSKAGESKAGVCTDVAAEGQFKTTATDRPYCWSEPLAETVRSGWQDKNRNSSSS